MNTDIRHRIIHLLVFALLGSVVVVAQDTDKDDILKTLQERMRSMQTQQGTQNKKYSQARAMEKAGLWEEAEKMYMELNLEEPGINRYFSPLRSILRQRKDWGTLIEYYQIFLAAKPDDTGTLVDLGGVYIQADSTALWHELFTHLIETHPADERLNKKIISKCMSLNEIEYAESVLGKFRSSNNLPDYYSFEMAKTYTGRMIYNKAMDEYLRFLTYHPEQVPTVSEQILVLPENPEVQGVIRKKLAASSLAPASLLLADLFFKNRKYPEAIDILKRIDARPEEFLQLGSDLTQMQEYDLADSVFQYVLTSNAPAEVVEETVFQLARLLELRTIQSMNILPISGFYRGNPFFTSPFLRIDENSSSSLWDAIAVYDSLSTATGSIAAAFRLGEIRFLALNDIDGARKDYQKVTQQAGKNVYAFPAKMRLVDLYIAEGDLVKAGELLDDLLSGIQHNEEKYAILQKQGQVLMYQGDLETLSEHLQELVKSISVTDSHFNDILEVSSLVMNFAKMPDEFEEFSKAQLLLQQNKRIQALEELEPLMTGDQPQIAEIATVQSAHLYLLQGNIEEAQQLARGIKGDSHYAELATILQAEILDHVQQDLSAAIDIYLEFLENYPLSIYYDDIRLRLRELAS